MSLSLSAETYPQANLPILQKLTQAYKLWQNYVRNFPKDLRYTLGGKIDSLFIETTEAIFSASYSVREQKLPHLRQASLKLDLLKFFLQLAWECKALDNKKFVNLSEHLAEIGRMLGGWQKQILAKRNPT